MDWYDTDSDSWLEVVFGDVNSDGYFDVTADIGTNLLEDLPILANHLIDVPEHSPAADLGEVGTPADDDLNHLEVPFGNLDFLSAPPW
jgi:hypothetical protein